MAQEQDPEVATFARERLPRLRERVRAAPRLELLCHTPEEFEARRGEMGIVRVAVEEDVTL